MNTKSLAEGILSNTNFSNNITDNPNTNSSSFVLLDTDAMEVRAILLSLKTDSAPGWDNISTKILKFSCDLLIPIITHLVNTCFNKGIKNKFYMFYEI